MNEKGLVAKDRTLFVVSAPSGAGKHTILRRVLARDPELALCVSASSRGPRPAEEDGKDYFFLDREELLRRVEAGDFVEWAEVHGNLYGTLREELGRKLASGKDVILQVDVQGMRNLKTAGIDFVSIFVMAPTLEDLEERLQRRGADSPNEIAMRIANAEAELAARYEFDHIIVNKNLDEAVADFEAIVRAQRARLS